MTIALTGFRGTSVNSAGLTYASVTVSGQTILDVTPILGANNQISKTVSIADLTGLGPALLTDMWIRCTTQGATVAASTVISMFVTNATKAHTIGSGINIRTGAFTQTRQVPINIPVYNGNVDLEQTFTHLGVQVSTSNAATVATNLGTDAQFIFTYRVVAYSP